MNPINKIGLGTAAIGRPLYINIKKDSKHTNISLNEFRKQGIEVLNDAYRQGVRYFDTAPGYGMAEEMLIDWVRQKNDKNLEIATKWGYTYIANFNIDATEHEVKEHSLSKLNEQWLHSKKLLPYLTTYQIHSATLQSGVLDNQAVLDRLYQLKDKYRLRIGLTSTGANQLEVINRALEIKVNGLELFDLFQVTYNVFDQSLALDVNKILKRGKKIVVKEALANGRVFPNDKYPKYSNLYSYLNKLALKYKVGLDAVALRFCIDSIPTFKVLSGASIGGHLADNMNANKFRLLDEEIGMLKTFAVNPVDYWKERSQLGWN